MAVEEEMRDEIEGREKEARKLREHIQNLDHKHRSEIEALKLGKQ